MWMVHISSMIQLLTFPPIHQFQQAGNLTNSKSLSKFLKKLFLPSGPPLERCMRKISSNVSHKSFPNPRSLVFNLPLTTIFSQSCSPSNYCIYWIKYKDVSSVPVSSLPGGWPLSHFYLCCRMLHLRLAQLTTRHHYNCLLIFPVVRFVFCAARQDSTVLCHPPSCIVYDCLMLFFKQPEVETRNIML